jgi:hypothetical protein
MTETAPPPPGYRDVSIPLTQIATNGLLLSLLLLILPLLPYWLLYGFSPFWEAVFAADWLGLFGLMLLLIVAHEGVHAIGWKFAGGLAWSQLKFGIMWKTLSPYCHAQAPMTAAAYRIGALLPLVITGILPWLIGLLRADAGLTFIGAVMISAAIGDLMVVWIIRRVNPAALVLDHPANAGCYVSE